MLNTYETEGYRLLVARVTELQAGMAASIQEIETTLEGALARRGFNPSMDGDAYGDPLIGWVRYAQGSMPSLLVCPALESIYCSGRMHYYHDMLDMMSQVDQAILNGGL